MPNTVMTRVPAMQAMIALFFVFLKEYTAEAGDDQAAAHHEVRQIADEGGRGTFYA